MDRRDRFSGCITAAEKGAVPEIRENAPGRGSCRRYGRTILHGKNPAVTGKKGGGLPIGR